jgi:hypothetical protein
MQGMISTDPWIDVGAVCDTTGCDQEGCVYSCMCAAHTVMQRPDCYVDCTANVGGRMCWFQQEAAWPQQPEAEATCGAFLV